MNRIEKIKKLDETIKILKTEFVGLDDIIDKIKLSISPWYITPEIIKRPVVISLWGMTGTGKTSVVKRLIELLDLKGTISFDCGEESNTGNISVADKISDVLNLGDVDVDASDLTRNLVFVFDEFQYARTIDETGREIDKPNLRTVWNIIDSGIINLNEGNWEVGNVVNFMEDLSAIVQDSPKIELDKLMVNNKDDVKKIIDTMGYYWYNRRIPGIDVKGKYVDDMDGDNEDPYRPLKIIDDNVLRTLLRKLGNRREGGVKQFIQEILECKTLDELFRILSEVKLILVAPKTVDCSKSLVFILGNLDEAFYGINKDDANPDIDADVFHDITSEVTPNDIKDALKKRFRSEQISRLGNSIIKYPTLGKQHFKEIIIKEVNNILDDFYKTTNIKTLVTEDFINLLYSEGVYPVQGVRPIFTTIGTLLTPLFSDILVNSEGKTNIDEVEIGIDNPEEGYKLPEKSIYIKLGQDNIIHKTIKLILGELRCPDNNKYRYEVAVHEIGHAIIRTYLTGKAPVLIKAVTSSPFCSGFCSSYDPNENSLSVKYINNEIRILLGGYVAEHILFKEDELLLGASSDLEKAWEILSDAVYNRGYLAPMKLANYQSSFLTSGIPEGINDIDVFGKDMSGILKDIFKKLETETINIIKDNYKLLKQAALKLGDLGELGEEEFIELIKKYGNTLCEKKMNTTKEKNNPSIYKQILEGIAEE